MIPRNRAYLTLSKEKVELTEDPEHCTEILWTILNIFIVEHGICKRTKFNQTQLLQKGKAILVTGSGHPQGCETSRLSNFLDIRLTDGGEVASLTRRPPLPQEDSWYSFLLEAESTPGP
jgi:hypothetical protein